MRVLIINKFLYPNGGSETYIFKLGEALEQHGHEVQYFGMEHEGRCVGNRVNAYTSDMDFHGGSKMSKLTYPRWQQTEQADLPDQNYLQQGSKSAAAESSG